MAMNTRNVSLLARVRHGITTATFQSRKEDISIWLEPDISIQPVQVTLRIICIM
jgi:hypothetical protein